MKGCFHYTKGLFACFLAGAVFPGVYVFHQLYAARYHSCFLIFLCNHFFVLNKEI